MAAGPASRQIGAYIAHRNGGSGSLTAGGAGDNTAITGQTIDRQGFGSAAVGIHFRATLAAAATLSLLVQRQQSADGTAWDAAETVKANAVVATGPGGGGTVHGVLEADEDFEMTKRYVRYNVTPDLSAATVDTATVLTAVALGGSEKLPV